MCGWRVNDFYVIFERWIRTGKLSTGRDVCPAIREDTTIGTTNTKTIVQELGE